MVTGFRPVPIDMEGTVAAPSKQTQGKSGKGKAESAKEAAAPETTEATEQVEATEQGGTEAPTAVDLGYAQHPDAEAAKNAGPTPGGAAETGADAANARQPVQASPLEEAQQRIDRRPAVEPQRHLSTSPVAAAAGQRSLVGQGTLGLVDEEGNDLNPDDIFDGGDGAATYVTTKVRVYERFVQRGARTPITRLLFPANARVPRDKADLFVAAAKAEAKNPLQSAAGRERMKTDGTAAAVTESAAEAEDGASS